MAIGSSTKISARGSASSPGVLLVIGMLCFSSCGQISYESLQSTEARSVPLCINGAVSIDESLVPTEGFANTDSIGTQVTSWTNPLAGTAVTAAIPTGYYNGNACTFTDANLIASNIRNGISLFGVTGSYVGAPPASFGSNMHRDVATAQQTLYQEAVTSVALAYPNADPGYRAVPKISKDDDGNTSSTVMKVDRTGWGSLACGLAGTIASRIADCAAHPTLGANATWDGSTKSNGGQGLWRLVTRTGAVVSGRGREVWQDDRTKLLWSSAVSGGLNWCKASGSNFIAGNPSSEDDPSTFCDSVTYQAVSARAVSACYEDNEVNYTQTDVGIDSAGKANLGLSSTPVVAWRLPTINDYQQANVNGIRFVVPETPSQNEWSATIRSANRAQAHVFDSIGGATATPSRTTATNLVRCVGR